MHPYYRTASNTWRNAIRHNLSINECFIRCGRASSGRGFNWYIHPGCVEMFRRGDFRRRELRRKVNEILQLSQMSKGFSPAVTPVNQTYTSAMTPVNQTYTSTMTPVNQTYTSTMIPVNQTYTSAITPVNETYSSALTPVNQNSMTPINQAAMTFASNSPALMHVNQNTVTPVNHIEPNGAHSQYPQHFVSMASEGQYYQCSTPQLWTSTPKHGTYS